MAGKWKRGWKRKSIIVYAPQNTFQCFGNSKINSKFVLYWPCDVCMMFRSISSRTCKRRWSTQGIPRDQTWHTGQQTEGRVVFANGRNRRSRRHRHRPRRRAAPLAAARVALSTRTGGVQRRRRRWRCCYYLACFSLNFLLARFLLGGKTPFSIDTCAAPSIRRAAARVDATLRHAHIQR